MKTVPSVPTHSDDGLLNVAAPASPSAWLLAPPPPPGAPPPASHVTLAAADGASDDSPPASKSSDTEYIASAPASATYITTRCGPPPACPRGGVDSD